MILAINCDIKFTCTFDGFLLELQCGNIQSFSSGGALIGHLQNEIITGTSPSIYINDVSSISKLYFSYYLNKCLYLK